MTRVIAMLNQKGGVGKTTSTVNLGAALALAGRRVCLVDLDPQSHLTYHLGIENDVIEHTVYDLLIDPDCRAADALIRAARPNLDAILAEVDLAGAETELASAPDRQSILRRKFAEIADDYDVVFIDCPPSLGLLTLNALTMANEIFVPMQAHFLALQGVGRLLETVGLVCRSVNHDLRVTGILLCMHEHQTTLAREIVADLDGFFEAARHQEVPWRDCRVLRPPIRRNIKLAEAPSFGQTIFDYAPWCPGALDYRKIADHLLERWFGEKPRSASLSVSPARSAPSSLSVAPDRSEEDSRAREPESPRLVSEDASLSPRDAGDAPVAVGDIQIDPRLVDQSTTLTLEDLEREIAQRAAADALDEEKVVEPGTAEQEARAHDADPSPEGPAAEIVIFRSISARDLADPAGVRRDDR